MKNTLQKRLRLNSPLLPIVIGLLLVLQLVQPYKGWVVLLVGFGGVWLVSWIWARSLIKRLSFRREMRYGWAQVGDQLEERFTLYNRSLFPAIWVEVSDHSTLPDYFASQTREVGTISMNSWTTRGVCNRRGLFTLGPTSLKTGDPFGIYTVQMHDPASASLMVMPPIVPLPSIEVAPGGRAGEGRPRNDAPERTVSSGSVREYAPGDSLHWIHWRTTARRGVPFVRIFDGTPAGDWWILLDLDERVQAGQGWDSTTEHGIILAASLADRGFRQRRTIGLVASGDQLVWLPPQSGNGNEARRWDILRALALINPGAYSLCELLQRTQSSIGKRSSLVIITPSLESEWIEALIPLLWRGVVPTVLLLDPRSFGASLQSGSTRKTMATLADMGVSRYLFTKDMLDRPEARPGKEGQWEWRVTTHGRAIAVRKPTNTSWKVLS